MNQPQTFNNEDSVIIRKIRITAVLGLVFAWIIIILLLYFLPQSTYQDLSFGLIFLLHFFTALILIFSFPAFVNQTPKWIIKLLDRRFTIEILFFFFNLLLLFLPIRRHQHFYWFITNDSPHPSLLAFCDGLTFFLVFFLLAAAWIRIKILLEHEKSSVVTESVFPLYTKKGLVIAFSLLITTLVLLLIMFPLLAYFYKQEIEEFFGLPLFFSLTSHIKHLITTSLVIFLLPPFAYFFRIKKYKTKFLILSFCLLFPFYFFGFYPFPLQKINFGEDKIDNSPFSYVLLSSLAILIHLFMFFNLVVRYQELIEVEGSFKTQQQSWIHY